MQQKSDSDKRQTFCSKIHRRLNASTTKKKKSTTKTEDALYSDLLKLSNIQTRNHIISNQDYTSTLQKISKNLEKMRKRYKKSPYAVVLTKKKTVTYKPFQQ